jgi:hypothetical protein
MEDARGREKVGGQLLDALPRDAILLTAPPQRASPGSDRVKPEGPECPKVRWHRVVGKEAGDDLPQPFPLLGDRLVHAPPQLPLNLLELYPHAVAPGPLDAAEVPDLAHMHEHRDYLQRRLAQAMRQTL